MGTIGHSGMERTVLRIASWNICGLCEPNRKNVVKNWISSLKITVSFLALQEVKADKFRLDL